MCDAKGVSLSEDAHRSANLANLGVGLGLGAVGVSAYLLLSSREAATSARRRPVSVAPAVARDGGAVVVGGSF